MEDPFAATLPPEHLAFLLTLERDGAKDPGATLLPTLDLETRQIAAIAEQVATQREVVVLGETLGEGGMGIVKLGTQTSLQREVAVKAVRDHRNSVQAAAKLVQEAWVTGSLEHPNIVPVYELAHGKDDAPLLVMRRIAGRPWSELLADSAAVRARYGIEDVVAWHLRVLMQLAAALEFAHSRGIIHLDIKPDNVMVGPLGEVYLVDWGLAMSLRDDDRLPSAAANTAVIGTPAFIAPEMLTGEGTLLGPLTDVYLLGATLYTILAGAPPHRGETVIAVVFQALQGTPEPLPPHVPRELADLVERAMQRDPAARFSSARAFRLALQEYLEHRGAWALVATAAERADELERLLERGATAGIVAAATEARFGYSQALAAWPASPAAREGLDRVTARYAIWCAERRELATAEGLAGQLSKPVAAVDAALQAARERQQAEAARVRGLEELGRDLDARTGQRTRLVVLGAVLVFSGALPLATPFVPWLLSWEMIIAFPVAAAALLIGLWVWGRESMGATRINRAGGGVLVALMVCQLMATLAGHRSGLTIPQTMSLVFPLWTLAAFAFTLLIDRRIWPSALAFTGGALVTLTWPPAWLACTTLCNFAAFANFLAVWRFRASRAVGDG